MQRLRTSALLARLVLAWLMLTLGVAVASPLAHPQAMELVCTTAAAAKLIVLNDDGDQAAPQNHHALDCPLCLQFSAPPSISMTAITHPQPLAHALRPVVAATLAALVGARPTSRPVLISGARAYGCSLWLRRAGRRLP
jgi:hypothetical protein